MVMVVPGRKASLRKWDRWGLGWRREVGSPWERAAAACPPTRTQRTLGTGSPVQKQTPCARVPRLEDVQQAASTLLGQLSWARLALRGRHSAMDSGQKQLKKTSGPGHEQPQVLSPPTRGAPQHPEGTRSAPGHKLGQGWMPPGLQVEATASRAFPVPQLLPHTPTQGHPPACPQRSSAHTSTLRGASSGQDSQC